MRKLIPPHKRAVELTFEIFKVKKIAINYFTNRKILIIIHITNERQSFIYLYQNVYIHLEGHWKVSFRIFKQPFLKYAA